MLQTPFSRYSTMCINFMLFTSQVDVIDKLCYNYYYVLPDFYIQIRFHLDTSVSVPHTALESSTKWLYLKFSTFYKRV